MNKIADITADRRKGMVGPLLKSIFTIFEKWELTAEQQRSLLGLHNEGTYYNWKKKPESATLSNDLIERTSYILGIWRALQVLIPEEKIADTWIALPNHGIAFNGQTPLDRMLAGQITDLAYVRNYLDHERGGW